MTGCSRFKSVLAMALLIVVFLAVPGAIPTARAQDVAEKSDSLRIDEIVVTSRKRDESLFEIPVSVTAFSADDIINKGLEELPDLVAFTPGFHYAENSVGRGGRFNRRIIFRGMNPRTDRQTRQSATVFIDGAPTIGSEIGSTDNYQRIEIIKGPQSAYFGRQTFSGAVNAVTKTPGNEFNGQISAESGKWGKSDFGVQIEGSIVQDKLAFRVSGRKYSTDGEYVNSGDPGSRLGSESTSDGSITLFFTPTEDFSAKLRVRRWQDDDGPSVGVSINQLQDSSLATCAPGGTFPNVWAGGLWPCGEVPFIGRDRVGMDATMTPALQALFGNPAITSQYIFDGVPTSFGLERNAEENSLILDWTLSNGMTISSITALNADDYASFEDLDRVVSATKGTCLPLAIDPTLTSCSGDTYQNQLTGNETFFQELRLTSSDENSFRWSVGVSYTKIEALLQGVTKTGTGFSTGGLNISATSNFNPKTSAIFGSIGWDFTDRFTLSVEGRYQEDEVVEGTVGGTQFEETFTSTNPRVILDFDVTDDTMVYASYAKGTQPGQFNAPVAVLPQGEIDQLRILQNCGTAADFDCLIRVPEEEVDSIELGIKSLFWGGRAQVSAALYMMDWTHIVAPNIVTITDTEGAGIGNPKNVQVNATGGQADLSGLELEGTVLLSEHFQLDATLNYVSSEIGDFESPDAATLLGYRQIEPLKNEFSRYPRTSGSLSLGYNNEFGADYNFFARGDYLYQGTTWMTNANVSKTPAFGTVNLRAGVVNDAWRIEAYATNVFDEEAYSAFQSFPDLSGVSGSRVIFAGFIPRQAYGIRATFFF
ncbi:MAG: TonB-dependent receptor [Woeseiaceae bacterium]|nr:TonB-dependent receptor [Woeseiaceae bacterium]